MEMKTIWIVDHYASEPKYGGIARQYDFAVELGSRGYNVVVISSAYSHFSHSYISEDDMFISKPEKNVSFVYLRTTPYQKNAGLGRVKNMFSFLLQVIKLKGKIAEACKGPDVVTGCSIHPLAWVAAYDVSKKYNTRFCIEIRDLWPWVFIAGGEKKKYDPMVIFFGALERWAYKKADKLIFSMSKGDLYAKEHFKNVYEKSTVIGQPMDCKRFDKNKLNVDLLPREIRSFMQGAFVCSFAGYYMTYEGVYVMLEAARYLLKKNIPIKMVFVGSGSEYEGMKKYVDENNLSNVLIFGRISKDAVPALLCNSSICMAHLAHENHVNSYRYGVSKNKVNEYLYSGACTLYGFNDKNDEVAISGGGMVFEPYNAKQLAEYIESIYNMSPEQRNVFGEKGRSYIQEHHSVQRLVDKMIHVLFD